MVVKCQKDAVMSVFATSWYEVLSGKLFWSYPYQDRGWEPSAVKSWLISAGWKGFNQDEALAELVEAIASPFATVDDLIKVRPSSSDLGG